MKHDLVAELAKGLKNDHLGHEKNVPETGSNTRNGYSFKTLLSDDGEIELNTPRDRENTFEPQLIKKPDAHHADGLDSPAAVWKLGEKVIAVMQNEPSKWVSDNSPSSCQRSRCPLEDIS